MCLEDHATSWAISKLVHCRAKMQQYQFAQQLHNSQSLSRASCSLNASKKKRIAVAKKDPAQICYSEHNAITFTNPRKGTCQARCYATSVANIPKEKSLLDVSADRGSLRDLPPVTEVGIREHLRAWQEAQLLNQDLPTSLNVHNSKPSHSRQNLVVHTRDDESPLLLHDTVELDEGFEVIEDAEDNIGTQSMVRQGDVVEFRSRRGPILAFFVQDFETVSQLYTMHGKCVYVEHTGIRFTIPGVVSPHELNAIRSFLPSTPPEPSALETLQTIRDDVPREVGSSLISKLQSIDQSTNFILREYAGRLGQAYEIMASPSEVQFASLQDIVLKVLEKSNPTDVTHEMLWAVHKTISHELGFIPDGRIHHSSQRWEILPRNLTGDFSKVTMWLRDYIEGTISEVTHQTDTTVLAPSRTKDLNPVIGFVSKVRRLVNDSRKHRPLIASDALGTSVMKIKSSGTHQAVYQISTLSEFTTEERYILAYLGAWCLGNPSDYTVGLTSIGAMILRATGLYGELPADQSTAYLLLREIGVIAPWENPYLYTSCLRSAGSHDLQVKRRSHAAEGFISSVRFFDSLPEDSMADIRKDWQAFTVYCIDNRDAMELDDGISLERIDGNSSEFWVHIHIANPSAFIKPDHPAARFAAIQSQSIYLAEERYPMLSPQFVQECFSLADRRPCLTFSGLLTSGGEIRSTKITPGVVNNVLRLTPQEVDHILDREQDSHMEKTTTYTVGTVPEAQPPNHDSLTTSQIDDLRLLSELGRARTIKRSSTRGLSDFVARLPEPRVYFGNNKAGPTFNKLEARRFDGDPGISLEIPINDSFGFAPRNEGGTLVANAMILAGEIAAKWAADRNIPICYRGTKANPANPISAEAYLKNILLPSMKAKGYAHPFHLSRFRRLMEEAILSTSPLKHDIIGCRAYARVTSPLRRFEDMLSHWQIETALRYEHRAHSSLVGNTNEVQLPYSRSSLENIIRDIQHQERRVSTVLRRGKQHWTIQLLYRAFYLKETQLPETFEMCVVYTNASGPIGKYGRGPLKELGGIDAWLLETNLAKREGGLSPGDIWETKLVHVECYTSRIVVEAVKLISREASVGP
ncbi:MAG: hypothetical protein Q9167_000211 [Letrouitia subvulpina]